jgi:hypothetical protein
MSFMSKVVNLCWLLIWMLFGSCAATFEILVAYLYGSFIKSLIQIFGKFIRWCLYIIYFWPDGFVFFMCFDQGVDFGCHTFYPYQTFVLVFVCFVTSVRGLLNVFLKSLFQGIIRFSCMKVSIFCFSSCILTMVLLTSTFALIRLLSYSRVFICFKFYCCLLCNVLYVFASVICFIFVVTRYLNVFCIFM